MIGLQVCPTDGFMRYKWNQYYSFLFLNPKIVGFYNQIIIVEIWTLFKFDSYFLIPTPWP